MEPKEIRRRLYVFGRRVARPFSDNRRRQFLQDTVSGLVIGGHVHLSKVAQAVSDGRQDIHSVEKRLSRHLGSEHWDMSPVAEAKVAELEGIVRDLTDKLKPPPPPRSQAKLPPAPAKKPTGRKPGGQEGRPPHLKKRLPPERVDTIKHFVPKRCEKCRASLPAKRGPNDPELTWHRVADLPPLMATITEYQGHYRTCPYCGKVNHAPVPADLRAHSVGPSLSAVLTYLVGTHGLSKRGVEEIVEEIFEAPIALGTVANLEQETSAALAGAHQEALDAVAEAPVKNVDETGWKQAGRKRWLWLAATASVAAFVTSAFR